MGKIIIMRKYEKRERWDGNNGKDRGKERGNDEEIKTGKRKKMMRKKG